MSIFKPKDIIDNYTQLDIKRYREAGFKAIFLDIDNTIAIPGVGVCDSSAEKFINDLKKAGFIVLIFSNARQNRVKRFIRDLDLNYSYLSCKPLPFAYWKQTKKYNIMPNETLILGDQLLTDILGANLSGCYGIYTKQLQDKDTFITSINRRTEKFIWRHVLHEKM